MNIAIDVSPLKKGNFLSHRVRGTGFYIENLRKSLLKYCPDNNFSFFSRGERVNKEADLIHYPYFEPFFISLPFFKKHKEVVTVHDLTPFVFPKYFPKGIKGAVKWNIQKNLLKKADLIITDSKCSKKDIVRFTGIPEEKINVVYLAAGEEFKKYQISNIKYQILRKKYNLPEKFLLYVGDATWNKNLPRLIEAVLKTKLPLVLAGKAISQKDFDRGNPWNQDLVKVQELIKNNKNLISLGFVPTDDLVLLYNIADAFIMPSIYEGFGLPVLEAMACGCPVITTREGSIPEIGEDAVLYVDAYDAESISRGIKRLLSDSNMAQNFSEKGLIQAKKFNWKKTALETLAVYQRLVKYEKENK